MSETKEYIIDQAYSLFLSRSYEAVSISDISKAIGLTKGALYHHFSSKEELFKDVIDKHLIITGLNVDDSVITLFELIEESVRKAKEIFRSIFGDTPTFMPINYMSLFIDAFRHYSGFANEKLNLLTNDIEKIKKIMDNAVKRKEIREDIDTKIMATNYFSITMGMSQNLLYNNSPKLAIESLQSQLNELYKILKI